MHTLRAGSAPTGIFVQFLGLLSLFLMVFNVFFCKKYHYNYYSQTVRVFADQAHVHISCANG